MSGLNPKKKLEIYYQDLDTDEYLFGPSIYEQQVVFESQNSVSPPSLESIDENSPNKLKGKRKRSSKITKNVNKKTKTENRGPSGIFVGYAKLLSEIKEEQKKERKIFTKKECINEVASVESIKEVERKLWLTHYDMLSKKLNEVIREKWYKKVLEMSDALNPKTLIIFRESIKPKEFMYKRRLRKWLIELPTIEV